MGERENDAALFTDAIRAVIAATIIGTAVIAGFIVEDQSFAIRSKDAAVWRRGADIKLDAMAKQISVLVERANATSAK